MPGASFAAASAQYRQLTLVDRTTGTNIGNMTGGGGLVAAFDGVTVQSTTLGARSPGLNPGWIGKYRAGVQKILGRMTLYAPSASNINGNNGGAAVGNINIYGKTTGQATTSTDGNLLYTGTFTDLANGVGGLIVDITSGILWQPCESIFVRIDYGANTTWDVDLAEVVMYERL